jgi:predicted nucleic acid-binding protein
MPGSFLDTNVLVYVASSDEAKADIAERLLKAGATISVQVLNEAANVARRKLGFTWQETRRFLAMIRDVVDVQPITMETHVTGLDLAERHGMAIFDAMIAAAALQSDCDTLWSEDMQNGLLLERRLRIRNPFRA